MNPLRILVTGNREWADRGAVFVALFTIAHEHPHRALVVVHGGARGADRIADEWATTMHGLGHDVTAEVHRADWDRWGKSAGHRRNAEMVKAGADICLAFPLGVSLGTRGCMAFAEAAGIPVVVHEAVQQ